MRFKIKISELNNLTRLLNPDKEGKCADIEEIELEPVNSTAFQAMYEERLKQKAFADGYHRGYREGFEDGRRLERPYHCTCGCNGTLCYNFHCGNHCK